MIPFKDAYNRMMDAVRPASTERIPLHAARGRILASRISAPRPMPPFRKAVVDGFACKRGDLPGPLRCVETVGAGNAPTQSLGAGECAKVMTGAPVPEGADCVILVEHSEVDHEGLVRWTGERTGDNIAEIGQDMAAGDVLLEPGHRLRAAELAVLATAGEANPEVYGQPRVCVITTGDELVEPGEAPSPVQIRNSNGPQTMAQLASMGISATFGGIARDTETSLREIVTPAMANHDVVILSGGVSMGDFDFVPGILQEHGVTLHFTKVAIQPGKPTVFGSSDSVYCFGLPGNPVSGFAIFELFVRPFLYRLMGHDYRPPTVHAPLAETFQRKVATREAYVPVRLDDGGRIHKIAYQGSAHINAYVHANGMISFPVGVDTLEAGTMARVRLLEE